MKSALHTHLCTHMNTQTLGYLQVCMHKSQHTSVNVSYVTKLRRIQYTHYVRMHTVHSFLCIVSQMNASGFRHAKEGQKDYILPCESVLRLVKFKIKVY